MLFERAFFIAAAIGPSGVGSGITSAEGGGGKGFSKTVWNSLNSRSSPGCICLAIIGKLLRRSLKVLISFLRGEGFELPEFSSGAGLTGRGGLPSGIRG